MVMGLLGAIGSSVAGGIQNRQAQKQAVDLAMLERQLDLELAQIKRDWKKEDIAEAREFERTRMEEVQAGLPAGVYATPSDVRISDTRRKAAGGGGGGSRKFDPVDKERLKYLEGVMKDSKEAYNDPAATDAQRTDAMQQYANAQEEHTGIWSKYKTSVGMSGGGEATTKGVEGFDVDAIFKKHGVEKKKEQPKRAAPEPVTTRVQDPGMSQRVGQFLQNRPPIPNQAQTRENTFRERLMQSGIAER